MPSVDGNRMTRGDGVSFKNESDQFLLWKEEGMA